MRERLRALARALTASVDDRAYSITVVAVSVTLLVAMLLVAASKG